MAINKRVSLFFWPHQQNVRKQAQTRYVRVNSKPIDACFQSCVYIYQRARVYAINTDIGKFIHSQYMFAIITPIYACKWGSRFQLQSVCIGVIWCHLHSAIASPPLVCARAFGHTHTSYTPFPNIYIHFSCRQKRETFLVCVCMQTDAIVLFD